MIAMQPFYLSKELIENRGDMLTAKMFIVDFSEEKFDSFCKELRSSTTNKKNNSFSQGMRDNKKGSNLRLTFEQLGAY